MAKVTNTGAFILFDATPTLTTSGFLYVRESRGAPIVEPAGRDAVSFRPHHVACQGIKSHWAEVVQWCLRGSADGLSGALAYHTAARRQPRAVEDVDVDGDDVDDAA